MKFTNSAYLVNVTSALYLVIDLRVLSLMLLDDLPVSNTIYLRKPEIKSFIDSRLTSFIVISSSTNLLGTIINKNECRTMVM